MRKKLFSLIFSLLFMACQVWLLAAPVAAGKEAEFGAVVKLIESHYGVKSKGIPLLARAGIRVAQRVTRFSECGSVKVAVFEDQDFSTPAGGIDFGRLLKGALQPAWQSLVEVYSRQSGEQTYIYTKEAGERFKVLVVTTGRRDGTVVQVELAPQKLAILLKDPETMGKRLTDEATGDAEPK